MDIKPNSLARNGTTIICSLLAVLIACSYFIKYPEVITVTAKLKASNTPKPVLPYQSGKLIHLFRQNETSVQADDIIGCMETTADWQEVLQLSATLDSLSAALDKGDNTHIESILNTSYSHLGELQSDYQAFIQAYIPFKDYVIGGYSTRKRALLQNDLINIGRSLNVAHQQATFYEQDAALSQQNLDNNKALLKDNVISEQEYRQLVSQHIGKKLSDPQIQSNYISIDVQKNEKQKELLELDNQIKIQATTFKEATYKLKSSIDSWKRNYLLMASVSGTLSFTSFIQENQVLETGKVIAFICPANNSYYLQLTVPQNNLGKIATGQTVLLKFDAWQWQEYGTVTGKIDYISNIGTDSGYMAKVILPNGLHTNRAKTIAYKEDLGAQAEIITNDISLLDRFYYSLIKQVKNQ